MNELQRDGKVAGTRERGIYAEKRWTGLQMNQTHRQKGVRFLPQTGRQGSVSTGEERGRRGG